MMAHLEQEKKNGNDYVVIIDPCMPKPKIDGVRYILYSTIGVKRIKFDFWDFKRICEENGVMPDVIFSLNNTGEQYDGARQIVYYHQPLPLYKYHFSLLNENERSVALFKMYFPWFVKQSLKHTDTLVVQTDIIRQLFARRFNFPVKKIELAFPDVERVDISRTSMYEFENGYYHFVYPATFVGYKEHITIARALNTLKGNDLLYKIKIHLTIKEGDIAKLEDEINTSGLRHNFVFHGPMSHEQLLSMYKAANGLLFPSVIETIGLPLLEAAAFGLPVLANDLEYVKEVLKGYEGLVTVPLRDYKAWGEEIAKLCNDKLLYNSYHREGGSDWPKIFRMIHGEE